MSVAMIILSLITVILAVGIVVMVIRMGKGEMK
jgi:hypothetical protein